MSERIYRGCHLLELRVAHSITVRGAADDEPVNVIPSVQDVAAMIRRTVRVMHAHKRKPTVLDVQLDNAKSLRSMRHLMTSAVDIMRANVCSLTLVMRSLRIAC